MIYWDQFLKITDINYNILYNIYEYIYMCVCVWESECRNYKYHEGSVDSC